MDELETVCPVCDVDFVFDLAGSWDDFKCPACAAWLTLEVDDWWTEDADGNVEDEGVDFSVLRAEAP